MTSIERARPSVSTPKDQAREGGNQARRLRVNEPTERAADAIYIHDEDDNDIATFFHSEHATVGQSYETALRLATLLVEANNGGGAPSPADPVRAALEALEEIDVNDEADRYEFRSDADYAPNDFEKTLLEDFGAGLLGKIEEALRAALSLSTPTGEGEEGKVWRPMKDAPTGVPIVAKHRPNDATPHGWIATIIRDFDDPDEDRRGGLDTILHYNGDALLYGFHGCWDGWMTCEEAAALAHPPQGGELLKAGWKLFHVALRLPTDSGYRLAVHVVRATDQYKAIGLACICEGGLDQPMLNGTSVAELDTVSGGVLRVVRAWRHDPNRAATEGLIEDPSVIECGSVQIIEPTAPLPPSESSGEEA